MKKAEKPKKQLSDIQPKSDERSKKQYRQPKLVVQGKLEQLTAGSGRIYK
jgi:hypothetical protein